MQILSIIQRYYPAMGGAESHAKKFIDYLSKKHTVEVYTTNASDLSAFWDPTAEKIHDDSNNQISYCEFFTPEQIPLDLVKKFPFSTLHPGPFSLELWNKLFIQKPSCDLIYTMSYPYSHILPAFAASKKWNIPIIITPLIHQEFPELFLTGMKLSILNQADAITVSTISEKELLENNGIKRKISVIPPAADKPTNIDEQNFREKNNISEKTNVVLFVGYKDESKGIIDLLKAMKLLWKLNHDLILIVIGQKTFEYQEYISELNDEYKTRIIDLERPDDITKNEAYAACDVFALPSKSESFGISYLEAWHFGKPVIGCDIQSSKDLITHKKDGMLVKFDDEKELADTLNFLLKNPIERKRLGNNGKEKADNYSWRESTRKFEQLCIDTVNNFKSH